MNDLRQSEIFEAIESESDASLPHEETLSIRVSPHGYLAGLFLGSFFSAFLFYIQLDAAALVLFCVSWILIPFFALNDRISFDGKRLSRTGLIPRAWAWFNGSRRRLKLTDIEQVETEAIRALKRGGNIFYRYRTVLRGKGLSVTIASGGDDYRRMIKAILPRLSEYVLDNRSIELRDHLADPKESLMRAEFSRIPSAEFLQTSLRTSGFKGHRAVSQKATEYSEDEVDELRSLANELRLSGYLVQALEAFRRALILRPFDAKLLFDFARCLHSFAGVERSKELERRALAALRLSERRAAEDPELLVRLGEWYFQIGEWRRAGNLFNNALERVGENFRSARGLAEIALREGKIAHVIHHFSTATRLAETPSLRRWSRNEADYFSNLNADDEYMDLEVSRVNMLETVEGAKKTALRIVLFAFPVIVAGAIFDDVLVANIGWAVSTVAILIWIGLGVSTRILSQRIPYDLVDTEE
ncbi:MAG: tetratricopeptide repeat protein [Pyrinomonadaceae bacterium]